MLKRLKAWVTIRPDERGHVDGLNDPKWVTGHISCNAYHLRVWRLSLTQFTRVRGGCSFEHHRGHYFNLSLMPARRHVWWSINLYLYYNESLRSR